MAIPVFQQTQVSSKRPAITLPLPITPSQTLAHVIRVYLYHVSHVIQLPEIHIFQFISRIRAVQVYPVPIQFHPGIT